MSYAIILFDLDGTLTDSAEGIVNSVVYALERKGIPYKSKQDLRRFAGSLLQDPIPRLFFLFVTHLCCIFRKMVL
jgi:phosphoglycolate phosphatase